MRTTFFIAFKALVEPRTRNGFKGFFIMELYQIYALVDPIKKDIRYIGRTKQNLRVRLAQHLVCKMSAIKYLWIRSLIEQNKKPIIIGLELCYNNNGQEKKWIEFYESSGCFLYNVN